jgi:hypothetical protein
MKVEIEWHKASEEKPEEGKPLLVLSKYNWCDDRYAKNVGLYVNVDNTKPEFYVHGNPDYKVVYWAYFPEMPNFIKDE